MNEIRRRQNGAGAGIARAALLATLSLTLTACGQSVGDLGRANHHIVTESYLPAAGKLIAKARGVQVSDFALTEYEVELRRRAYRLIMPAHAANILELTEAEAVRARIWPDHWRQIDLANYADDLHRRYDGPAEGRYGKIILDASSDLALIDPFYSSILAVHTADISRIEAFQEARFAPNGEADDVDGRLFENRRVVHWGVSALRWRLMSYAYGLERARIEVPNAERAKEAAYVIEALAQRIKQLEQSVRNLPKGGVHKVAYATPSGRLSAIK